MLKVLVKIQKRPSLPGDQNLAPTEWNPSAQSRDMSFAIHIKTGRGRQMMFAKLRSHKNKRDDLDLSNSQWVKFSIGQIPVCFLWAIPGLFFS